MNIYRSKNAGAPTSSVSLIISISASRTGGSCLCIQWVRKSWSLRGYSWATIPPLTVILPEESADL